MKTLDGMARDLFNKFAAKEGQPSANWNYLGGSRKLEWMQEVLVMARYFLDEIKTEIKPVPNNTVSGTAYGNGFNDGVRSERASFLLLVEQRYKKLLDEYEDFCETLKK